jgi:hypothetical protein
MQDLAAPKLGGTLPDLIDGTEFGGVHIAKQVVSVEDSTMAYREVGEGDPNLEFCRGWLNQSEVTVEAKHFFQEDAPVAVGQALREWISALP